MTSQLAGFSADSAPSHHPGIEKALMKRVIVRLQRLFNRSAFLLILTAASAPAEAPKRVLILDSFGRDVAPFNAAVSTFRTTLGREMGERVDIYEASLDAARFAEPEKEAPFVGFLKTRFESRQPDLVVTVGAPAATFMARNRDALFPATPTVFMGADPRMLPPDLLRTNATLVTQRVNLPAIIEDILQMRPDTTNVVVVFGASPLERFWLNECHREFQPFTNRVGFVWLNDLSLDKMQERLAVLPPHSFIMFGLLVVDATGVPYDSGDALVRLHAFANAPFYGYFASEFGSGAIGGRLYQDTEVGVRAARAAVRILRGERPENIPPQILDTATPVYDWRELRRWHINEALLPAGSSIQFRQPSFWELYRGRIIFIAILCAVQTGLIVGLVLNRIQRRQAERSLRESEARFRTVANSAPVLIWMSAVDKHCTFFNKSWLDFTGRTLAQELGNGWTEGVHPDDRAGILGNYQKAFDARQTFTLQYRLRRHDGEYRWITDRGVPRFDNTGNFTGYIGSCMDVTENLRAEEKFRLAVEASPNAMLIVNQPGLISLVNAQVEKVFGYSREELLGRSVETLIPDRFCSEHPAQRTAFARHPQVRPMGAGRELFGRRKDGSEVPVEIGLNPITTSEGKVFLASIVDVTERKEMERQQREFKRLLITAHEAERARLARELHDDITQRLARLAIDLGRADQTAPVKNQPLVREELIRLSDDVHALSYQLHPSILEDLGLVEALRTDAEQFIRREGIPINLQLGEIPSNLPPETALGLYRITQEALRNIARHAKASTVGLALESANGEMKLVIRDDGTGFDAASKSAHPRLGLSGMKERANLLGGDIEIASQPGKGTILVIRVPVSQSIA